MIPGQLVKIWLHVLIGCMQYTLHYRVFFICRVVRLTSPNLNYLIIAGALLLYASVVFLVTPTLEEETATIYCNVSVVMEPLLPQARARVLVISAVDLTHLVLIQPFSINTFSINPFNVTFNPFSMVLF